MRRGDIYRVYKPQGDTKQHRLFVIVSRQALIDTGYATLVCAPIFTDGAGLSTQVAVGASEGLKHDSWIVCENLRSVPKTEFAQYVGSLTWSKLTALNRALAIALGIDFS
jgi:mRNA interferase MazF